MFNNNFSTVLLNIKDTNIDFSNSTCKFVEIKGIKTIVIPAVLRNKPTKCPCCGSTKINTHGYKSSKIKIPSISGCNATLDLKKQRYQCQNCKKTFIAKTSIVDANCYISNNTKTAISIAATKKISEKDIAIQFNVSHNTVNRIINSYRDSYKINYNYLPKSICFDEFKSTKDADGAMSFIYVDAETHKLIDIVENRKLNYLIKYFMRFSRKARNRVKFVVMDMYTPYISLVKTCFPNAKIIFDKFHIVNLISRAVNKTRIKVMNKNKSVYNKFKRYYKLLLKYSCELDSIHYYKYPCFDKPMSQSDIVDFLLEQDINLKNTYEIYQNLLSAIKQKDSKRLEILINSDYPEAISDYMKTALKTLKKHSSYIINSIIYKFNNGPVEGINNKIKVIKRIAFGYRSFFNFRNRILIMNHLICT